MINQTRAAIIAIAVIIPLSSIAVLNSAQSLEFAESSKNESKIVVMASFFPLYEFAKEVGKDKVDVSLLVPQGVEPHDWEPSIQDLQRVLKADIVVINGMGFEKWIEDVEKVNSDLVIIDSSVGIRILNDYVNEHDDQHDLPAEDPHIWLNPLFAKIQVQNIANGLKKIDPSNVEFYNDNSENYIKKLDSLDLKIRNELSDCKKDFIVFHSAFTYFANEYGLNQHTILSSNEPHGEPTSKNLEKIIKLAKEMKISTIFTEEAVDQRTSQVIANELGGRVLTLSPLEVSNSNISYIEKMEENFANLKEVLCS